MKNWTQEVGFSKVKMLVTQSCLTLCNLMECRLPDSSIHRISQARILEWVAIPFSVKDGQNVLSGQSVQL